MKGAANLRSRLLLTTSLVLAGSTAQAAVEIDTDFGTEFEPVGVYEQPPLTDGVHRYNDVLRAPDGDYVLVGFQRQSNTPALVVTRLSADGTEQWTETLTPPDNPSGVSAEAATIDDKGRILVAGWVLDQDSATNIVLARLNADSTEDQIQIADIPRDGRARDITLDSHGNAYIVGETFTNGTPTETDGLVARFTGADLDAGKDPIVPDWTTITDFDTATETRYEAAAIDETSDQLVAVGWTTDSGATTADRRHIIDRVEFTSPPPDNPHSPDTGIGTDGATAAAYGLDLDGANAAITGIIYNQTTSVTDAFVQRLDGNNEPDPAFGTTDGMTTIEPPVDTKFDMLLLRDIVIDTRGGYLLTGSAGLDDNNDWTLDANEEVAVGRLLPDGSPDTAFASGDSEGYLPFIYRDDTPATRHVAEAITVDDAGRFLVAGSYNSDGEEKTQNQASAMAFTADELAADDDSSDDSDGGGGGGGGAFSPPLLLFGLMAMATAVRRRLHA